MSAKIYKLPVERLSNSKKANTQALIDYYENKIQTLLHMNLPPKLVLLACWDAPVEREDLRTKKGREKFIKKCLKYYQRKVKELEKKMRR